MSVTSLERFDPGRYRGITSSSIRPPQRQAVTRPLPGQAGTLGAASAAPTDVAASLSMSGPTRRFACPKPCGELC